MVYVISDIHGEYKKYKKMLELIKLRDEDELFVLGDVIDRGPEPVKILRDMCCRYNVFPIMGNHEHLAEYLLKKLCTEITEENYDSLDKETLELIRVWLENGGQSTIDGMKELSMEERQNIIEYFEEFTCYEEIEVNGNKFVLVHGGFDNFSPDKRLSDYDPISFLYGRVDYTKVYYKDKYLVTGHVPTGLISPEYSGKIIQMNNHIAIDCGACFDKPLGCIRLDDFKEFYVE